MVRSVRSDQLVRGIGAICPTSGGLVQRGDIRAGLRAACGQALLVTPWAAGGHRRERSLCAAW